MDDLTPQPIAAYPTGLKVEPTRGPRKKRILIAAAVSAVVIGIVAGILTVLSVWYQGQLQPINKDDTGKVLVTVEAGSTPQSIADTLENDGLIRSATAFMWHARLEGVLNSLQAGAYRLSPSESTPQIVEHLASGKTDTFTVTFLPGATLADNREALIDVGYSAAEVDAALATTYDLALFEGKPAGADFEGYIYGETYSFGTNTSVEAILQHVFEYYDAIVKENDLVEAYAARGLSLYEGITLASIVQREASPGGEDMPHIAQVFYSRLEILMSLGSDVTYQYIADKTGVARDPNLDSPYNTRRYPGLPPGPIAVPGLKALLAVAHPTDTDDLFFLSGDDDITYFGRTQQEHEANIVEHCQLKCQIL